MQLVLLEQYFVLYLQHSFLNNNFAINLLILVFSLSNKQLIVLYFAKQYINLNMQLSYL